MKRMNKITGLLLIMALLVSGLTGVPAARAAGAELTAEQILEQSGRAFAKAKSYQASLRMKLGMKTEETDQAIGCSGTFTVSNESQKMKINLKLSVTGIGETKINETEQMQAYFSKEGKKYYYYSKAGSEKWEKYSMNKKDYMDLFKINSLPEETSLNWEVSEDTVDGNAVWVLTSAVTVEDIEELMDELLDLDDASVKKAGSGPDEDDDDDADDEDGDGLFENMKLQGIHINYYIDKETMLPVSLSVDMKDFIESLAAGTEQEGLQVEEACFGITFRNFNKAVTINVPAAAKKAKAIL